MKTLSQAARKSVATEQSVGVSAPQELDICIYNVSEPRIGLAVQKAPELESDCCRDVLCTYYSTRNCRTSLSSMSLSVSYSPSMNRQQATTMRLWLHGLDASQRAILMVERLNSPCKRSNVVCAKARQYSLIR